MDKSLRVGRVFLFSIGGDSHDSTSRGDVHKSFWAHGSDEIWSEQHGSASTPETSSRGDYRPPLGPLLTAGCCTRRCRKLLRLRPAAADARRKDTVPLVTREDGTDSWVDR